MCGIAGIIGHQTKASRETAEAMMHSLKHRGPDDNGLWQSHDGETILAHTRLAISGDSEHGQQPMQYRHLVAVFNGEIHNHKELRKTLENLGHEFLPHQHTCDTEILLHAWLEWGLPGLDRINGMWAAAIHNIHTESTTLIRDRYGIKPLYYHSNKQQTVFASEVKTIDLATGYSLEPNFAGITPNSLFEPEWRTHLKSVYQLEAGHYVTITPARCGVNRKWYHPKIETIPEGDHSQEFLQKLSDACELRRDTAGLKTALCLSGGIDSNALLAILTKLDTPPDKVFTLSLPGTEKDEARMARDSAKISGVDIQVHALVSPPIDFLEKALAGCDGPMPTPDFLPIWAIHEIIRKEGFKITIDGMGSDELLGGYYIGEAAMASAIQSKCLLRSISLWRTYAALYPQAWRWVSKDALRVLNKAQLGADLVNIKREIHHQMEKSPLPFLLNQYDRCSMSHGIETRTPFLDHNVVNFGLGLHESEIVGKGFTKLILRKALKGLVREEILKQKRKLGFTAAYSQWINGPWKSWAQDLSNSQTFRNQPVLSTGYLAKQIQQDKIPASREVWTALHTTWWQINRKK